MKPFTSPPKHTPSNAQKYGLALKAPKKIYKTYYTWPDRPHIALHASTVQWIKDHIPTGINWLTIRDHKRYTPYRECPPRARIDKLLGDYMLGVGTPPDWDDE